MAKKKNRRKNKVVNLKNEADPALKAQGVWAAASYKESALPTSFKNMPSSLRQDRRDEGKSIINMYYLYILKCTDKTLYTGITVDLKRRLGEHNSSKIGAKYTRARRPVKLVYFKKFRNRSIASKEEAKIKALPRKEKINIIKNQTRT